VRTLVIGIGNDLRGDDGAGPAAIRILRSRAGPRLELRTCSGEAVELMETWGDAEVVVLVDAISSGGVPGSIHHFEVSAPLPATTVPSGSHSSGLPEAVALAEALGRLPPRLIVFGVEGACFKVGAPLSPAVSDAIEVVCRRIHDLELVLSSHVS
jgi:hydrogenase maturation protease